ncbi:MAG: AraC family transcriptional regulator [Clostridiales bacterium]|nr:AraC family transcriptional regulator [Clostridiales bacterium]
MGLLMDYYHSDALAAGSLHVVDCGYHRCDPSHTFGPCARDYFLIHFVLDGEGEYLYGGRAYRLGKDMGFVIFPDDVTTYRADAENPWFYYWVGFKGTEAERLLSSCGLTKEHPVFECREGAREAIMDIFHRSKEMNWNEYILTGCLYLFFAALQRQSRTMSLDASDLYLEKAVRYIHDNFMYDFKVEDIADHLFIHRSHLYRIFSLKLKQSPSDYILNFRLERAARLLLITCHKVTDIAGYCGFKNASQFCKAFKAKFGISPLCYRKERTLKDVPETE